MLWFGRKKKLPAKPAEISARLQVIPESFYGAQDPVVHYGADAKKTLPPAARISGRGLATAADFLKNKIFRYTAAGLVFVIIIVLISWYYINEARPGTIPQPEMAPAAALQPAVEKVEEEEEETLTIIAEEPSVPSAEEIIEPQSLQERIPQFPGTLLVNSPDLDSDALTDLEEEIFSTDSGIWDTDGDGYYDGQEVYNLYNPIGLAPVKLIDSGLVAEYINSAWQYRVYYPIGWQVGLVDPQGEQVLFSSITGDYVEISVFKTQPGESFADWFARRAGSQKFTDLQEFSNRFQEAGKKRNDDLVAYFPRGDKIYLLIYNPGSTGFIPYRQVMRMIWQSFRPSKTSIEIPEQTPLPAPPDFST